MTIQLFEEKKDCCACGACENICPKGAIAMMEDREGFLYPHIDTNKCIECRACKRVCSYQNGIDLHNPITAFAAVNKDREQLMHSASGGVFSAIARYVINNGGIAVGASLIFENGRAIPKHIIARDEDDLLKIQGSKYVQSSIQHIYKEVRNHLNQKSQVLFSGTPCQVAGLYGFLGRQYDNLITIDLICHGVPNANMFNDYLNLECKNNYAQEMIGYSFRDKKKGWGMNGRLDMKMKDGSKKTFYIPARLTSYNSLFLDGITYRQNCYSCPYAHKDRVGDLTIGDYWGIEKEHPEILGKDGFIERDGISCILANTKKGVQICKDVEPFLQESSSTFEKISHKNGQLNQPTTYHSSRDFVMEMYAKKGYKALDDWFKKKYRKQLLMHAIYNSIPRGMRVKLKSILKK